MRFSLQESGAWDLVKQFFIALAIVHATKAAKRCSCRGPMCDEISSSLMMMRFNEAKVCQIRSKRKGVGPALRI